MKYFQHALLVVVVFIVPGVANAEMVKKTSSGICHPPASSYYDRTNNFRPFDSVEECLASGGRLPNGLAQKHSMLSLKDSSNSYDRSTFGHGWDDADGDCQNYHCARA